MDSHLSRLLQRTNTMKYLLIFVALSMTIVGCKPEEKQIWKVVPYPNMVSIQPGGFSFDEGIDIIVSESSLTSPVNLFSKKLNEMGISTHDDSKHTLSVELTSSLDENQEAYKLEIGKDKITLTASHPKGIFYGLMTIWQGVRFSTNHSIPCGIVQDSPRFGYRGFMLDESRHFFGKDKVMEIIELMSEFKLNTFHWHLTDSPGWRIDIKAFPKLATIGGQGNQSNPDAPAQYYTQEEIKEIVAYAAERQVTIIPEIDMPGHATAANRAYPEYSGGGSEKHPDFTFNPGKENTYAYLTTILREIATLFPSEYIHLGGDEVHFGNEKWNNNKEVKSLMKREGFTTLKEVEFYFIRRIADSVSTMGKKIAGWDEVTESDIPKENLLIYWWRHDKPEFLTRALNGKYSLILCPRLPLYFDFLQHESHKNGRRWKGIAPVEDVYGYPDLIHSFTNEEMSLINGIQGNLWTERFQTNQWLDFMMFPRMMALSESAWTEEENKDFIRFESILPSIHDYLDERNVYYYNSLNNTLRAEPDI